MAVTGVQIPCGISLGPFDRVPYKGFLIININVSYQAGEYFASVSARYMEFIGYHNAKNTNIGAIDTGQRRSHRY